MTSFSLASEIRRYNQQVPIIFLTARSQPDDRIRGFKSGADDYVCKPFSIEEFKCRIEAVLKRTVGASMQPQTSSLLTAGNSTLDFHNLTLSVGSEITRLTYKEAKLLQLFFRHTGKLIARDLFMKTIWESDGFFVARSMDVFISRLRKYLKKDPVLKIENVRSVGYVLKVLQASGQ